MKNFNRLPIFADFAIDEKGASATNFAQRGLLQIALPRQEERLGSSVIGRRIAEKGEAGLAVILGDVADDFRRERAGINV
jgi:hypothetical protein